MGHFYKTRNSTNLFDNGISELYDGSSPPLFDSHFLKTEGKFFASI